MMRNKENKFIGKFDPEFRFLLNLDPAMEGWRAWAAEYWVEYGIYKKDSNLQVALTKFLVHYLHGQSLHTLSAEAFFGKNSNLTELANALDLNLMGEESANRQHDDISDFLDWILRQKLSVLDSESHSLIPDNLANPFPRKRAKNKGQSADLSFKHVLQLDPKLDDWRSLAQEWMTSLKQGVQPRLQALNRFLVDYIHGQNLEKNFGIFLLRETEKPELIQILVRNKRRGMQTIQRNDIGYNNGVAEFLDWILQTKLGDPDTGDWDRSRFHNPIQRLTSTGLADNTQSDKSSLSIRYIRELRSILAEGLHFRDWSWAQQAMEDGSCGGDWFVVDPSIINPNDPDCVVRQRNSTKYEIKNKGYPLDVWEMWSPVRAVALYLKLELPLRTFQVRMLDSGEADTWRYVYSPGGGSFVLNASPLSTGSEKRPYQQGVFHRSSNEKEAGLYINTNKTADINKSENDKGYVIPWANDEVLYWLEKLRNWQDRYNPISSPTAWAELEYKHFGYTPPHPEVLEQRGAVCFLFRDPTDTEKNKPLTATIVGSLWYKLLEKLEKNCAGRGETLGDGTPIGFIDPNSEKGTSFPLHSLRVSLISYFILDLKLPIAVVSKMIAGHATIIMTLYYTKFGKSYLREVLSDAEKNEIETDHSNHHRFLQDATYEQVSQRFAYVSEDAVRSVVANKGAQAAFVFEEKGICPNGATLCSVGGEKIRPNADSSDYAPVPGFHQNRNCVCCRFFLTGPAFLPGLIAHFNTISEKAHRQSARYSSLQDKLTRFEDEQREAERENQPFLRIKELDLLNKHVESEAITLTKLVNDLQATNHLIQRSIQIAEDKTNDGVKLVAKGSISDLKVGFIETQSVLHQLEVVCENAVVYPDIDASNPTLRRSQILDAMLLYNGMEPIMMFLDEEKQLLVGNAVMKLIQARTGSIVNALPYAECRHKLEEIGLSKNLVLAEIASVKAKTLINHAKTKRTLAAPKGDQDTGDQNASY